MMPEEDEKCDKNNGPCWKIIVGIELCGTDSTDLEALRRGAPPLSVSW